ncbi:helix-turn-helix domain-containing protein [Desulfonema magnum]|uniref:HTH domain-containing protein n=1 Tax=Desulfonema magnum TaxID=45655 RepID=A0A975BWP5_9BACT|nr:helix-turn-helix domain-containing protein [Desulfonema magnum]QTA93068.1 HTH domain-containing protein [Desulfonema magnum]
MKKVLDLTEPELTTLQSAQKNHPCARVRDRARVIILSNKGRQVKKIADICEMTCQTVYTVISRWEENGLGGLYGCPRSGRPCVLTPEDEDHIHQMVEEEPRSVNKIIAVLEDDRVRKSADPR